jgi:hypothetical protein
VGGGSSSLAAADQLTWHTAGGRPDDLDKPTRTM